MLLTATEMINAEQALFAAGVEAEDLMDEAAGYMAQAIGQFLPHAGEAIVFVGSGHNGGDALVVARLLMNSGWQVSVRLVTAEDSLKPLTQRKYQQYLEASVLVKSHPEPVMIGAPLLVIDGLLGIGARGAMRPPHAAAAEEIRTLRAEQGANVVAIDVPSGLDATSGVAEPGAVIADITITVTHAKTGLLTDKAQRHVGRLALAPVNRIQALDGDGDYSATLITPGQFSKTLPSRHFDTHKGQAGRVGIIAGSTGMTGAATLCARGALRGGAGLVTLFSNTAQGAPLTSQRPPESMRHEIDSLRDVQHRHLDAIAIGPGLVLDKQERHAFTDLILDCPLPMVIDAGALNIIAEEIHPSKLTEATGRRLLTPHPGEMCRLETAADLSPDSSRRERVHALATVTGAVVLLKGSRTVIAAPEHQTAFNTSGHPGMATGGVGDTLTGLCAALAADGIGLYHAACIGSWINGRAAELAVSVDGHSARSLLAGDLPDYYGRAFSDFHGGAF